MAGTRSRDSVAVVSVDRPRRLSTPAAPMSEPRPRRRPTAAGAGLTLLLAGTLAGLGWAFQSDALRVRQVEVNTTSPQVRQAVEDMVAPGCSESWPGWVECPAESLGPNELTFSAAGLQAELRAIPLVKSATVKAQLPNGLRIDVVERQPEAGWVVGSQVFRVADDGKVIDQGSASGLKVVIGQVAGDPVKTGDVIPVDVIKGAELLQEQAPAALGGPAQRIQYSTADGLSVIGDQELVAMFGPPTDLNLKLAELQRVVQLAKEKKTSLALVDLRYKTPYLRMR
jgi:cell division septal protein FtsQ